MILLRFSPDSSGSSFGGISPLLRTPDTSSHQLTSGPRSRSGFRVSTRKLAFCFSAPWHLKQVSRKMGSISRRNTASLGCEVSLPTDRTAWFEKLDRSAPAALTSSSVGSVPACGASPRLGNSAVEFGGVTRSGCAGASVAPSNANASDAARGCQVGGLGFMGWPERPKVQCGSRGSADKKTPRTGSTFHSQSVDAHGERTVNSESTRRREDVMAGGRLSQSTGTIALVAP